MNSDVETRRGDAAVAKALSLFQALVAGGRAQPLTQVAGRLDVPVSTAYRLLQPFFDAGLLVRLKRGAVQPGLALLDLAGSVDTKAVLAGLARPVLMPLARTLGLPLHLGVLEEDMVTYLVKAAPRGTGPIFTHEGMQLEAYCSGIGKVLLAHLPAAAQDAYLAQADFVALTARSITDPAAMRAEWARIIDQGFGEDREEVMEGLHCIAVPLALPSGRVIASLSASCQRPDGWTAQQRAACIAALRAAALVIAGSPTPR